MEVSSTDVRTVARQTEASHIASFNRLYVIRNVITGRYRYLLEETDSKLISYTSSLALALYCLMYSTMQTGMRMAEQLNVQMRIR